MAASTNNGSDKYPDNLLDETTEHSDDDEEQGETLLFPQWRFSGNFRAKGDETEETKFLHVLFEVRDKKRGTNLKRLFEECLEMARSKKKRVIDWSRLHPHMPCLNGTGYSATVTWIFDALRDIVRELDDDDIGRLWSLANAVYEWRKRDMKQYSNPDRGHKHALDKWKQVKELMDYFNTVNEIIMDCGGLQ